MKRKEGWTTGPAACCLLIRQSKQQGPQQIASFEQKKLPSMLKAEATRTQSKRRKASVDN